ncbi:MAG: hypothetical protein GX444_04080 [Myxococcales bacterium]|nr:hypothetical protein [Myxococcales bacterium]
MRDLSGLMFLVAISLLGGMALFVGCADDDDNDNDDDNTGDDDNDNDNDESPPCDCLIDGQCYAQGDRNPAAPCYLCDAGQAADAWTANGGGSCSDGFYCNGEEMCDPETLDCLPAANPCDTLVAYCDEENDECVIPTCADLWTHYYHDCGKSLGDTLEEVIIYCCEDVNPYGYGDEYFLCVLQNWDACEAAANCIAEQQ